MTHIPVGATIITIHDCKAKDLKKIYSAIGSELSKRSKNPNWCKLQKEVSKDVVERLQHSES